MPFVASSMSYASSAELDGEKLRVAQVVPVGVDEAALVLVLVLVFVVVFVVQVRVDAKTEAEAVVEAVTAAAVVGHGMMHCSQRSDDAVCL